VFIEGYCEDIFNKNTHRNLLTKIFYRCVCLYLAFCSACRWNYCKMIRVVNNFSSHFLTQTIVLFLVNLKNDRIYSNKKEDIYYT
jgi:hypothetical protein